MPVTYNTVIFDLDGTLLDSAPGIYNGLRHTLDRLGLIWPDSVEPRLFLGPPLAYSFRTFLGLAPELIDRAVEIYREYYGATGALEARPYPGIFELLWDLKEAGARVCLATSKYSAMAEKIMDHFGLRSLIGFAAMSDGREVVSNKKDMILRVLEHCGAEPREAVMVGDTQYDAKGASEAGVPFIGVLYGYGRQSEMEDAGGGRFVADVPALRRHLIG